MTRIRIVKTIRFSPNLIRIFHKGSGLEAKRSVIIVSDYRINK